MNASKVQCKGTQLPGYKKVPTDADSCYPGWEDILKNCIKKLSCDPFIVKLALGRMVIVGDQIDYIQRVVVDSSVTSQAVPVPAAPVPLKAPPPTPDHGPVGTVVTINGTGFGTTQGTVKFGATAATVISDWSDSGFKVTVPIGLQTGVVDVVVTYGGPPHDLGKFTVDTDAPATP
jgi:hypothetical protein